MTVEERVQHQYKPGDRATVRVKKDFWTRHPPVGTAIAVTEQKGATVYFTYMGHDLQLHKEYIEPLLDGSAPCSCPTHVLMTTGCKCGGS